MDFDPSRQQHCPVPCDGGKRTPLHRAAQSFRV